MITLKVINSEIDALHQLPPKTAKLQFAFLHPIKLLLESNPSEQYLITELNRLEAIVGKMKHRTWGTKKQIAKQLHEQNYTGLNKQIKSIRYILQS